MSLIKERVRGIHLKSRDNHPTLNVIFMVTIYYRDILQWYFDTVWHALKSWKNLS